MKQTRRKFNEVMAIGREAGTAHLTLGLAACSVAEVGESLSCPGPLAFDAEKLYLLAPELQQEPSWCPVSPPPDVSSLGKAAPADWESSS